MSQENLDGGGATPQRGQPSPYGVGARTVTMRVPKGMQSYIRWCILFLPEIMDKYHKDEGLTRSWDKARQLRRELLASQQAFIEADSGDNYTIEYRGFQYLQLTEQEARDTHF